MQEVFFTSSVVVFLHTFSLVLSHYESLMFINHSTNDSYLSLSLHKALVSGQGDLSHFEKHCRKALSLADQGEAHLPFLDEFLLVAS